MHDGQIQVIALNDLNRSKVKEIVERSFDGEFKAMDDDTVCLFDISAYAVDGLSSLIIQNNGKIYYSKLTTQRILDDFGNSLYYIHSYTCTVAGSLGFYQKIPYIIGERCIIPLDGYSKRPATWIVATNIVRQVYDSRHKVLNLVSMENCVLKIAVSETVFNGQNDRAIEILTYQLTLHQGSIKPYKYTYRKNHMDDMNIVAEKMKETPYGPPKKNFYEVGYNILESRKRKFVQDMINEGFLLDDEGIDY